MSAASKICLRSFKTFRLGRRMAGILLAVAASFIANSNWPNHVEKWTNGSISLIAIGCVSRHSRCLLHVRRWRRVVEVVFPDTVVPIEVKRKFTGCPGQANIIAVKNVFAHFLPTLRAHLTGSVNSP